MPRDWTWSQDRQRASSNIIVSPVPNGLCWSLDIRDSRERRIGVIVLRGTDDGNVTMAIALEK